MRAKNSVVGKLLVNSDKFNREQVAQTLVMLLEHAHSRGASDIHIEPRERFILVRYRIDGVLRGVHKLPLSAQKVLFYEIKKAGNMNPEETDMPQDGQYDVDIDDSIYTVKVSTLPIIGGEKIVLRLLPQSPKLLPLEAIGLWGENLESVRHSLTANKGLILIAGPKRSGKTTTLYSLLHILNTPLVSVVSIEDPIEHRLSNVSQIQVNSRRGIGFNDGLQAALQQDANIVMVSSLSDKLAIELAVHAANAGHLILAGAPADSASQAVLQLRSSGVSPFILGTALHVVIGQRLVRRLCPSCSERFQVSEAQRELLDQAFELQKATVRKRLHELEQHAAKANLGSPGPLNSTPLNITHLWQSSNEGCKQCDYTGYQGQLVLCEVMKISEPLREIIHQPHLSTEDLQIGAEIHGLIPIVSDGLVKALRGLTTVEELLRVLPVDR